MNDILGLIDSLEATLLEAPKLPLTDKLLIEEKKLLQLIDKLRVLIKEDGSARKAIDINKPMGAELVDEKSQELQKNESLGDAKKQSSDIIRGANEYAEIVLSDLQLSVSKLQNQLIKLERNIENGRDILAQHKKENENQSIQGVMNEI
jgi:hypothetical protein